MGEEMWLQIRCRVPFRMMFLFWDLKDKMLILNELKEKGVKVRYKESFEKNANRFYRLQEDIELPRRKLEEERQNALDKLEEDQDVKKLLASLQDEDESGVKLSAARSDRITKAQDAFMQKQIDGMTVRQMIENTNKPVELPETNIPIETINDEWHHMKATNFEKEYIAHNTFMDFLYNFLGQYHHCLQTSYLFILL